MTTQPPEEEPDLIDILASDGTVLRQVPEPLGIRFDALSQAMDNFARFGATRGGIRYEKYEEPDPREGEDTPIKTLRRGTRVFILGDVFTVASVDMRAPIPTVWLKEMPNSPLYFNRGDAIPLANESTDQP